MLSDLDRNAKSGWRALVDEFLEYHTETKSDTDRVPHTLLTINGTCSVYTLCSAMARDVFDDAATEIVLSCMSLQLKEQIPNDGQS